MNRYRLGRMGIELPEPKKAVGLYRSTVVIEGLFSSRLLVSGHGPWADGKATKGKLGENMSVQDGRAAARLVGLGILSSIDHEVGLGRVTGIVKALGMVNSTPTFVEQPAVIDGFSELMIKAFGHKRGIGTRSAVSLTSLPFGIAVEIEAEFIIKPLWLWKIQRLFGWC
jgi:YjgF/chorismate_mutase-like, putative endoribonuclease